MTKPRSVSTPGAGDGPSGRPLEPSAKSGPAHLDLDIEAPLPSAAAAVQRARAAVPHLEAALNLAFAELERASHRYQHADDVHRRLKDLEAEHQELLARLRESEEQTGRLMTLYVAAHQLHCTLDPEEVQSTIVDIILNLLGAESFVLLMRANSGSHYEPVIVHTTDGELPPPFLEKVYQGGDPLVDASLEWGGVLFGPVAGSDALAVVPLRVQDVIAGCLVIFRLLSHKSGFLRADSELFDLMGAHAASALVGSRLYAGMARKVRTLEELVSLVRMG